MSPFFATNTVKSPKAATFEFGDVSFLQAPKSKCLLGQTLVEGMTLTVGVRRPRDMDSGSTCVRPTPRSKALSIPSR